MKTKLYKILGIALTVVLLAGLTVGLAAFPAGAASSNLKFVKLELPKVEAYQDGWTYWDNIDPDEFADSEGDFWATPAADPGPIAITPDGGTLFAAVADGPYFGSNWYHVLKSLDGGYSWTVTGFYDYVSGTKVPVNDYSPIVDIVTSPEYSDDTALAVATDDYVYISEDGGKTFTQLGDPGWGTINDLDITVAEDGDLSLMVATDDPEVYVTSGLLAWTEQEIDVSFPSAWEAIACAFLPTFADDGDIGICAIVTDYSSETTTLTISFADISIGGEWGDDIANAPFTNAEGDDFDSAIASIAFPDDFDPFGTGNNVIFVGLTEDGSLGDTHLDTDDGSDAFRVILKEAGTSQAVDLDVRGVLTTLLPTATSITSIDVCGDADEATILVGTDAINVMDTPMWFSTYISEDSGDSWAASMKCPTGGSDNNPFSPQEGLEFFRANTRVVMAPDFCDSGVAYATTQGLRTDAFHCTTDANMSWNQISLVDYAHGATGYTITAYGFNAFGYNAEDTLYMITQTKADAFCITATADDTDITMTEDYGTVSVVVMADADGDAEVDYNEGTGTYTITLPDTNDAVLVTASTLDPSNYIEVTWTATAGSAADAVVTDNDGDVSLGGSGSTTYMYDLPNYGSLFGRLDGSHWERILSYANPGVTDTLFQLGILGDGSAMFASDLNNCKIWRSTDMGATWPKTISTKAGLTWVAPVSTTTLYTGHAAAAASGSGIWWTERSGTGWEKPDDSDIPASAVVASVSVAGDIVTCGTFAGAVYISSDGGLTVERVGSSGPFDAMVLEGKDLGFADNGILYAAAPGNPEVQRCVVDLDDPGDAEWEQIDGNQGDTPAYDDTNFLAGSPPICLPPSGILYLADLAPVDDDAGGLWRSTNPTADTDSVYPPYFERENKGLSDGDMLVLKSLDLEPPNLTPTFFFQNATAANYYDQIVLFTDILNVGVSLVTPEADAVGVGLLPENMVGDVYPVVTFGWQEMAGATNYQYQVSIDANFKTKVLTGYTDTLGVIVDDWLLANTTYYWRVRVADEGSLLGAPLISPWSQTFKFKTAIGPTMQRPALQAPLAGETGVSLSPTFEWSGIEWAEDYEYELALSPTTTAGGYFTEPLVALVGADALVSTAWKCDITLDYSTRYYWHVKALGVDTDTPWSDVGTFTTMAVPPAPTTEAPPITIPPTEEITPAWIWAIVIIGAILVIAVIVLIVTTRRVP
jgi:hypothetical protein